MYKKDGSRGLYTTSNGDIIHSDLNGAADIGRKALSEFDGVLLLVLRNALSLCILIF